MIRLAQVLETIKSNMDQEKVQLVIKETAEMLKLMKMKMRMRMRNKISNIKKALKIFLQTKIYL